MYDDNGQLHWTRILGALVLVLVVAGAALILTGGQVSRILSTVGASVGASVGDGGIPVAGDDIGGAGQRGAGGVANGASGDGDTGGIPDAVPLTSVTRPDLLVIKTGTLSLQVAAVDRALGDAGAIVTSLGGYAAGSDRTGDPDEPRASVSYRIPAVSWETAFARLRGLAQQVLAEHSSTEDVSARVVDLGARLTNMQATERALQAIMDRAGAIQDVLAVQSELTTVRGQIEELSAEKAHLEAQAAYSTLEVTFTIKPPNPVHVEQAGFDAAGEVDRASARLVGIGQDLAVVGIWFGIVWLPILVALGILGGVAFVIARRLRRDGPIDGEGATPAAAQPG
jgi:hypothetical protein